MVNLLLDEEIWGLNKDAKFTNGIGYFSNDKRYLIIKRMVFGIIC